jgi:hypothetical protein
MGMNGAAASVQRTFPIIERMALETTFNVYNLFNHKVLGGVNANPTDPNFGRVVGDGLAKLFWSMAIYPGALELQKRRAGVSKTRLSRVPRARDSRPCDSFPAKTTGYPSAASKQAWNRRLHHRRNEPAFPVRHCSTSSLALSLVPS